MWYAYYKNIRIVVGITCREHRFGNEIYAQLIKNKLHKFTREYEREKNLSKWLLGRSLEPLCCFILGFAQSFVDSAESRPNIYYALENASKYYNIPDEC